jgi:histone H3/H4
LFFFFFLSFFNLYQTPNSTSIANQQIMSSDEIQMKVVEPSSPAAVAGGSKAPSKNYAEFTAYVKRIFKTPAEDGADGQKKFSYTPDMYAQLNDVVKRTIKHFTTAAMNISENANRRTINHNDLSTFAKTFFGDESRDTHPIVFAKASLDKYMSHKGQQSAEETTAADDSNTEGGDVVVNNKAPTKAELSGLIIPPARVKTLMKEVTGSHISEYAPVYLAALIEASLMDIKNTIPQEKPSEEKLKDTIHHLGWGFPMK